MVGSRSLVKLRLRGDVLQWDRGTVREHKGQELKLGNQFSGAERNHWSSRHGMKIEHGLR